jgi:hypothetical protein
MSIHDIWWMKGLLVAVLSCAVAMTVGSEAGAAGKNPQVKLITFLI